METIIDIENKANELLISIQNLKNNPTSRNEMYNYTISSFYENFHGLKKFIKGMRMNGYLGMSPQKQEDLNMQLTCLQHLDEIFNFVEDVYNTNKKVVRKI